MTEKKPLLGLCPIGKFVFSNEDAIRQKQAAAGEAARRGACRSWTWRACWRTAW